MSSLKMAMIMSMIVCLTGCLQSLHPLFTRGEWIFDPGLVGTWTDEKSEETLVFEQMVDGGKKKQKAYTLVHTDEEGDPARLSAYLGKIGDRWFLDIYPEYPADNNEFVLLHLMPMHTFHRIWMGQDTFEIAMLDREWFKRLVEQQKVDVAYEDIDGTFILSAPTPDLQAFVRTHAGDEDAFCDPSTYHRKP